MRDPLRWCALLAAIWLGLLLAVAAIATPSAFAVLLVTDAGRVAGQMLAREAAASLGLGVASALLLRVVARQRRLLPGGSAALSAELLLVLAALFCTVAGYYGIQPWMADARQGSGRFSFGQLHLASSVFYAAKVALVATLAWRCSALLTPRPSSSSLSDAAGGA